jgi:hypothetical protein
MSPALVVIVLFAILLGVFQFFLRYEYVHTGSVLWRVDRLTRQVCRVAPGAHLDCSGKHSTSLSVSPSLSVSTSTAVGRLAHHKP